MSDRAKVLGIFGSPRKGGNTDLLLEELLSGAAAEHAQIDRMRPCDLRIAPCTECLSCFGDGACVIADDMQEVYRLLLEADIVVLSSPIFFYGITGSAKILVDRCQALWARKYILRDPALAAERKGRGFFLSVGGTKGKRTFEGAILTVKYFFDAFNAGYCGELLFRGVDALGDILKLPEALPQAFAAGRKLVADFRGDDSDVTTPGATPA